MIMMDRFFYTKLFNSKLKNLTLDIANEGTSRWHAIVLNFIIERLQINNDLAARFISETKKTQFSFLPFEIKVILIGGKICDLNI